MPSRLLPSRSRALLPCLLLFLCISTVSVYSIPFSTVFRRTQALFLRRAPAHRDAVDRIPPFLRKQQTSSSSSSSGTTTTTTTTHNIHSLVGGFAESSSSSRWTMTRRRKASSLSSTMDKQEASVTDGLTATSTTTSSPTSTTTSSQHESVHLKLGSEAMLPSSTSAVQKDDKQTMDDINNNNQDDDDNDDDDDKKESSLPQTSSILYTYHDAVHNISLSGLNVSKRKFSAWVNHTLHTDYNEVKFNASLITSKTVAIQELTVRQELRSLWRERQLLTDRTEILAIYQSEQQNEESTTNVVKKRGGFSDLLHIYAERLSAIIQDEEEEYHIFVQGQGKYPHRTNNNNNNNEETTHVPSQKLDGGLLGWLQRDYGENETMQLLHDTLKETAVENQYAVFQHFLEWFRSRFPYYYDRCDTCGASTKDEPEIVCIQDNGTDGGTEEDVKEKDDDGSFLGYVYPTDQELLGKASRTEIYQCHKCGSFTRFPRYNAASSVIQNRRGRCGEYSMLLYRILRATGHTARWIVDWADHVWAEVYLDGKWIHLDPCEAAVDKPLLYEEWGKQQTYIVAFHAPLANGGSFDRTCLRNGSVPLIEDVTLRYTSSPLEEIQKRRDESDEELAEFVDKTIVELEKKLDGILNR